MARKFCVMTVGRSGSTSLMESLARYDDIAVPAKNIDCEDNELVHPRRVADHLKHYSALCKTDIRDQNELIESFFKFNESSAYAGFKSMPNRHNANETFLKSGDTQIITLRRRDIASTSASFLRATDTGSWRRHGENRDKSGPHLRFNAKRHADRIAKNVAYIFQSHRQLAGFLGAIHLYYEDLCDPEYSNKQLDDYFGRPIRLENPKPPTTGSSYLTNWEEFSRFVDNAWLKLKKAARGSKLAATARSDTTQNPLPATIPDNKESTEKTDGPDVQGIASPSYVPARRRRRTPMSGRASRRVFYAWELGMDLGHLLRFHAPALKLRERGYEVSFAVRDLSNAETTLGHHGFPLMQAPIWIANVGDLPKTTISYAEIALRYGFISYPGLKAMIKAWRELFKYVRPGLVLTDHSPTALLAARSMGLNFAPIGSGFFNPPMTRPLPSMRYWNNVPSQRIEKPDTLATKVANMVLADLGGQPLQSFADLFQGVENFLCTFKELDHYPNRAPARYWGPTFEMDQGMEMKWPAGSGQQIFAYIKPRYRDFEKLLETLRDSGSRVLVYTPGITQPLFEKFTSERLQISRAPLKLRTIIKESDLVICHGGPGTVTASLLAGVPLLLLPTQLEQFMSTRRVVQSGAAIMVTPPDKTSKEPPPAPDYPALIQSLLTDNKYRNKAGEFARKYARFNQAHQARAIATRIEELLG